MAVGPWTFYNNAKLKILDGTHDFNTHTFRAVPLKASYTPALTHATLADLNLGTNEVLDPADDSSMQENLGGLALAGADAAGTWRVTWNADELVLTSAEPVDVKYVAIYNDTDADDALVCYFDTDNADADGVTITQLTVTFPNGIFRLA